MAMVDEHSALRLVTPQEAVRRWDVFEPLVARVLDAVDGGLYPDNVLTAVQFGSMHLWDILDGQAICVTELQDYPRYRQMLVYLVAGTKAKDWIASGNRQLDAFAKSQNCKYVVFQGRPGWKRFTERMGYGDEIVMMRKKL